MADTVTYYHYDLEKQHYVQDETITYPDPPLPTTMKDLVSTTETAAPERADQFVSWKDWPKDYRNETEIRLDYILDRLSDLQTASITIQEELIRIRRKLP